MTEEANLVLIWILAIFGVLFGILVFIKVAFVIFPDKRTADEKTRIYVIATCRYKANNTQEFINCLIETKPFLTKPIWNLQNCQSQ